MKSKILAALKSRTVWTGVVLFLVAGVDGIKDLIPQTIQMPLDIVLTYLIVHFRVNAKQ